MHGGDKHERGSPGQDVRSPEHQRLKPTRQAPIIRAAPLSSFPPIVSDRPHGRFSNLPRVKPYPVPRFDPQEGPSHISMQKPIRTDFGARNQPEDDREESPDPMNLFDLPSDDAQMADAFQAFQDDSLLYFDLQEAVEFAFEAAAGSRLPSEPNQWKDIKGRADAEKWHEAAVEEFSALLENGTFEPVQLPPDRKAIGCRWVFKLKRKPDGASGRKRLSAPWARFWTSLRSYSQMGRSESDFRTCCTPGPRTLLPGHQQRVSEWRTRS